MIGDISKAEHIYIAAGYTDMRKQIDGLSPIIQHNFNLDSFSNSVFLFCGRNSRIMKVLYCDYFALINHLIHNSSTNCI
ncbi:IS66 family insertion sequence element accessory protein TnpB [Massilimicrobiota timonensis]|uniref:IS66 family insertion sequence element accessory protein TnpB n=1 Tax=Massilimicrobiota timonensis TaxID=1776392 RepID=UPI0036F2766D